MRVAFASSACRVRETIERVHEMHRKHCPVYRSICAAMDITTTLELLPE